MDNQASEASDVPLTPDQEAVDIAPTWQGIVPGLIAMLTGGQPEAKDYAILELRKCAALADLLKTQGTVPDGRAMAEASKAWNHRWAGLEQERQLREQGDGDLAAAVLQGIRDNWHRLLALPHDQLCPSSLSALDVAMECAAAGTELGGAPGLGQVPCHHIHHLNVNVGGVGQVGIRQRGGVRIHLSVPHGAIREKAIILLHRGGAAVIAPPEGNRTVGHRAEG